MCIEWHVQAGKPVQNRVCRLRTHQLGSLEDYKASAAQREGWPSLGGNQCREAPISLVEIGDKRKVLSMEGGTRATSVN